MKITYNNETFTIDTLGHFEDGSPALQMTSETGLRYLKLTFCAHDGNEVFPATKGCFWLKDWSENEQIAQFLVSEGYVEYTGREIPAGFVTYKEARLKEGK